MPIVPLRTVLESNVDPQFDFTESTLKRLQDSTPVNDFIQGVQILYNQVGGARMSYTVFGIDGVAPTQLEEVLARIRRGGRLPKWYEQLRSHYTLTNLDGKTIGSVIEMLLVAVLEKIIFQGLAADNWVIETQKDLARFPNSNEWARILTSPLDGQIGMSPALQWRYNFSRVFGVPQPVEDDLSLSVD
jgi:hypothetical protein